MLIEKTVQKGFYTFGRVLLFYIGSVIIFATASGLAKGYAYADHISLALSSLLTFFLIVLFLKWEKLRLSDIGIDFERTSVLRFLGGFGIGATMVVIQAIITSSFADVTFVLSQDISVPVMISSLILYLLVALREELVFRSYSLRSLANSVNPVMALVTITIIFIFEHVIAGVSWKMSVIGSGLGGILFGLTALKTNGIALPFGIHSAWNFSQWMLGFKNDTGIWREIVMPGTEAVAEDVALSGFAVATGAGILGVLIFYRNVKTFTR